MIDLVRQPVDAKQLMRSAKKTARELRAAPGLRELRIAVLGGSTTNEVVTFLELALLQKGFAPTFWQSEYGRYWEDSVLDPTAIADFAPDLVYVHTGNRNIQSWPAINADAPKCTASVDQEIGKLLQVWEALQKVKPCPVIQNNFELPDLRVLGNLDGRSFAGATYFVHELNRRLAEESRERNYLLINDIHYISAKLGLDRWYDPSRWFSYKLMSTLDGSAATAANLAAIVGARYGLSKKVLVLDLDNTMWGGVIGDDGADRIVIGRETAQAEAYTQFQEYCRSLKDRGVVLAVSSKNNDAIAREGFSHPDSILRILDFAAFRANWEPKHENIKHIAEELSLGLDSFVFVDDNPAERALVAAQLPMVAVPDVGDDVTRYAEMLDAMQYFEPVSISAEDMLRAEQYASRAAATQVQASFANYGEYLDSLNMVAEIDSFNPTYLDRITQLTNKTNQFNLTTRRYSAAEIASIAVDPSYIKLYAKLSDRFGDHGLISVVIGHIAGKTLHIDLWIMSCRVLKRDVERLMMDELAERALEAGLHTIKGYYLRTPKNDMVSKHYESLDFEPQVTGNDASEWTLSISNYQPQNRSITRHDATGSVRPSAAAIS